MKDQLIQIIQKQWVENPLAKEIKAQLEAAASTALPSDLPSDLPTDLLDQQQLHQALHPVTNKNELSPASLQKMQDCLSAPLILNATDKLSKLQKAYDTHMKTALEAFQTIRGDNAPDHWKELNNRDFSLIPPVVIFFELHCLDTGVLNQLSQLMQDVREFKLIVLHKEIHQKCNESGRGLPLQPQLDLGFFGLFYRAYYCLQIPALHPAMEEEFTLAMQSPRPALVSIYAPPNELNESNEPSLAELALETRAFPFLKFNPEKALSWKDALDLSLNPNPHELWANPSEPLTLAHFLYAIRPKSFKPLEGEGATLLDWLNRETSKEPYVEIEGNPFVLSKEDQTKILSQIQLWEDLQSMAGIHPEIGAASTENKGEKWEEALKQEKETAVYEAMETLSKKLLGVKNFEIQIQEEPLNLDLTLDVNSDSKQETATKEQPQPKAQPKPQDTLWIETPLCTACDECTGINPRIFAYNKDKQAIIQDPKAGPYADIVKAAEKCSAAIIHPGSPLNPKEKNLKKWIKRAEKLALK